jgi:hypothetical protein
MRLKLTLSVVAMNLRATAAESSSSRSADVGPWCTWDKDPMLACQTGTQYPILQVKQDNQYPIEIGTKCLLFILAMHETATFTRNGYIHTGNGFRPSSS